MTANELAKTLSIQTSAIRKHLEQLRALEVLGEEFRKGSVGRPKKFFSLTETGHELFHRSYDTVLNAAIAQLRLGEGDRYPEQVMNRIAKDVAPRTPGEPSISGAEKILNEIGFEANVHRRPDHFIVTSKNCPLLKTAKLHQEIVCRGLHEELLKAALNGKEVHREKWIVDGDAVCRHIIKKENR